MEQTLNGGISKPFSKSLGAYLTLFPRLKYTLNFVRRIIYIPLQGFIKI